MDRKQRSLSDREVISTTGAEGEASVLANYDIGGRVPLADIAGTQPTIPSGGGTVSGVNAPRNLSVTSQTFRYTEDGKVFVDIVLQHDDVPGAVGYEYQIQLVE